MKPLSKTAIGITILVVGAIAWLLVTTKNHQTLPGGSELPSGQKATLWPSVKVSEETIEDTKGPYRISAVYPVTASPTITGAFKTFVETQIQQFKEDTAWAADMPDSAEVQDLTLDISYTQSRATFADNYTFTVSSYTGGAHGLQATKTFSFDQTGIMLTLDTIFTNGKDGLKTIAPYVQAELKKRAISDDAWIEEGAAPLADNYQSFTITDTGLVFSFGQYQVAPYVAGVQTVEVPVSVFRTIANTAIFPTR